MFFSVTCLLATVSAAVAVLVMWFSADSIGPANLALAEVLRPIVDAQTLQLSIARDGLVSNVFVKHPGLVRVEESPTRYLSWLAGATCGRSTATRPSGRVRRPPLGPAGRASISWGCWGSIRTIGRRSIISDRRAASRSRDATPGPSPAGSCRRTGRRGSTSMPMPSRMSSWGSRPATRRLRSADRRSPS